MSDEISKEDQIKMAFNNLFLESQVLNNHVLISKTVWETIKQHVISQLEAKDEEIASLKTKIDSKE